MATELVNFQAEMSRDRFKQEVALIVVDRLMQALAAKNEVNQSTGETLAVVAEMISDTVAAAFPTEVPT